MDSNEGVVNESYTEITGDTQIKVAGKINGEISSGSVKNKIQVNIEDVFTYIGEFGIYQKTLSAVLFVSCLPASYQIMLIYFTAIVPSWKCVANSTVCRSNETHSPDDFARCNIPRSEWYYTEPKGYSLVTEFDLDCEKEWLLHLASSMIFVGWGLGAPIIGWLGDHFGRKSVFYPSVFSIIVISIGSTFVTNIYQIMVCQLIIGLFIAGTHLQACILTSELVESKHRPLVSIFSYLSNPIGWCILTLKAYLIMDWRLLYIVCSVPYIFVLVFYKFVPESIKWLHYKNNHKLMNENIKKIARWNKKELPSGFEIEPIANNVVQKESNKTNSLFPLCENRGLTKVTILQGFLWMVLSNTYYGLHIAADDLEGSVYLDFILINLVELPAIASAIICCSYFGRKRATLIPAFVGSTICVGIGFLSKDGPLKILKVTLGLIGDFFTSIAFNAIYPWTIELYPINIRNEGMGFLQVLSHISTAAAPWIVKALKRFNMWSPFVTLGAPTVLAALLASMLNETRKAPREVLKQKINAFGIDNIDAYVVENNNVVIDDDVTKQDP